MPERLLPLSIASIVWFCVNHLVRAETLVLDGQMKVTTQNMVLTAEAQRRGEHRRIIFINAGWAPPNIFLIGC